MTDLPESPPTAKSRPWVCSPSGLEWQGRPRGSRRGQKHTKQRCQAARQSDLPNQVLHLERKAHRTHGGREAPGSKEAVRTAARMYATGILCSCSALQAEGKHDGLLQVSADREVAVSLFEATEPFGNPVKAMYSPSKEADVHPPAKCNTQFQGVYRLQQAQIKNLSSPRREARLELIS